MADDHDTIVIRAPVGTKTRWVRQSQAQHRKLGDWVVEAVDKPDDTAATEATTKAAQALAMAVQDLREALTHAMQQDNTPRSEP